MIKAKKRELKEKNKILYYIKLNCLHYSFFYLFNYSTLKLSKNKITFSFRSENQLYDAFSSLFWHCTNNAPLYFNFL